MVADQPPVALCRACRPATAEAAAAALLAEWLLARGLALIWTSRFVAAILGLSSMTFVAKA